MDTGLTFYNDEGIEREDLLHSEKYIQEFHDMVTNSHYSVYAICGAWGTGKTCFVKIWENKLKSQEKIFVHIDAFRMDYETEPFLMLIRAFNESMKKNIDTAKKNNWQNKAKKLFSIKNMAKLGVSILVDKTIGVDPLKEFINNAYNTCFDALSDEESLYDQLIASLTEITNEFNSSVYIIIDELDRCRPDFALETLERIKHIFHVRNVKFVLVYNEQVITSMINNKYGSSIDAKKYLTKFIEKRYVFDNTKQIQAWFMNEIDNPAENFSNMSMKRFLGRNAESILKSVKLFNLSLRDIQQILNSMKQYLNAESVYGCMILTCIAFLKYIDEPEFNNMVAYYNENKQFAENEPRRETFVKIFNSLTETIPDGMLVSSDKAFYDYMKELL